MPEHFRRHLLIALWLGIVCLPVIFFALRRGRRTFFKNMMSGCAVLLLVLVCASWVILGLIRFAGLEMEWRGGYVPIVTWQQDQAGFRRPGTQPQRANQTAHTARRDPTNQCQLAGISRAKRRRHLQRPAHHHQLAGLGSKAIMAAGVRRRLLVVRAGGHTRVHAGAAPRR